MMMEMVPMMVKMLLIMMFPGTNGAGLMCSGRRNVTVSETVDPSMS